MALQLTDTLLLANSAGGTAQLPLAQAAQFFGAELVKEGNPLGASLSSKAEISAQKTLELTAVPSRTVTLTASELQAYLDSLPRLVTEYLNLLVTGDLSTAVELSNFYGPGSIAIQAHNGFDMRDTITVRYCSIGVFLGGISFFEKAGMTTNDALLEVESNPGLVTVGACTFTGLDADRQEIGINAARGSKLIVENCSASGLYNVIQVSRNSTVSVIGLNGVYVNNTIGIFVWRGGIVMLSNNAPDTLGGTSNTKVGGLIINNQGEII